jgi:bacterioferritin
MKGNDKIIATLNELQAVDEMHHAEWLIARIIFLEGTPVVSKLNPIKIGVKVADMVAFDEAAELGAIRAYNAGIRLAHEVDDQGTVDLLTKILKMEEDHVDWNERQRDQIAHMGPENYLTMQSSGAA